MKIKYDELTDVASHENRPEKYPVHKAVVLEMDVINNQKPGMEEY